MNIITIGKRLVPVEQIALVEPFDPAANPEFKPEKDFKGRVILLNRDTLLAELTPEQFAEAYGLHLLADDHVAVSASLAFRVETFEPTESFKPAKDYKTRIKWRDADGNEQSKLLIMEPEKVIEELVKRGAARGPAPAKGTPRRPGRSRRSSRRTETAPVH